MSWKQFKRKIATFLFADYKAELDTIHNAVLEADRKSLSVADLIREQLKGFNPQVLDENTDVLETFLFEAEKDEFMAKIKEINNNPHFFALLDFLVKEQLLFLAKEANDLSQVNFGRATINGISLIKEEVQRISRLYDELHDPEPKDPEPHNLIPTES